MNHENDDESFLIDEEEEFLPEVGLVRKEGEESAAILVGVYSGGADKEKGEEYLSELESLADTFGVTTVARVLAPVRKIDAATYLHEGKLDEIKAEISTSKANLLIFDEEISPAQQRNLEKYFGIAVMDRTELILEIFAARAQTKEAKLQIELAKMKYQFPRLKRLWSHFSRQRASGGFLKGEGEKQLEIDRRLLRKKVDRLQEELRGVRKYRETQKSARLRSGIPTFAIIGYTNAGKSTLLNALTEAGVLVENKLFATLDPTTRKFTLPNKQEILLTDTVGFIRKLPHTLVAAFRSTLEAATADDVLLHLIDASHPMAEEHAKTTHAILKELASKSGAIITVLNKIDQCQDRRMIDRLRLTYPKTVLISATTREGFDDLMDSMMRELAQRRQLVKIKIPQSDYALVSEIKRDGQILYEEYEENDIILKAEVPVRLVPTLEKYKLPD